MPDPDVPLDRIAIARICAWYAKGRSLADIAQKAGVPLSTVYAILHAYRYLRVPRSFFSYRIKYFSKPTEDENAIVSIVYRFRQYPKIYRIDLIQNQHRIPAKRLRHYHALLSSAS